MKKGYEVADLTNRNAAVGLHVISPPFPNLELLNCLRYARCLLHCDQIYVSQLICRGILLASLEENMRLIDDRR